MILPVLHDGPAAEVDADVLAVFVAKGEDGVQPGADATQLGETLGLDLAAECKALGCDGGAGSVARIPTRGGIAARLLLIVGLGSDPDVHALRKAAGTAARKTEKDGRLALVVPSDLVARADGPARAQAVAEGAGLGAYAYTAYRSKDHDQPSPSGLAIVPGLELSGELEAAVATAAVLVEVTCLARDLVNTPPAQKRPPQLAERIAELAREAGVAVTVLDTEALEEGRFGGILGVGRGSSAPPRLVELVYEPDQATGHVALIGKGITFDSGGLSLKPSGSMVTMKCDMSGAAAVAAAVLACERLQVKTKVTGLLALAENMPSGDATRVSDVLTHRDGTTVEVMNTDAEGRLVMADALAYAAESEPDAMIDVATLTGAQIVALGESISALMGTDDDLVAELEAAAEATGERLWRLPLPEDYADALKSSVADLKNIGRKGEAGTIVAGLFLKAFTAERPWAHLDIAGPAFSERDDGALVGKGGTGVPVRTLLRYLQSRG